MESQRELRHRTRVCKRCKYATADARQFLHHQINAHDDSELDVLTCDKCEFVTTTRSELVAHQRTTHRRSSSSGGGKKMLTDQDAGLTDEANNNAKQSIPAPVAIDDIRRAATTTKTSKTTSSLHEDLVCHECGDPFPNLRQHLRHIREHHDHDLPIFECQICDFAAEEVTSLNTHIEESHNTSRQQTALLDFPLEDNIDDAELSPSSRGDAEEASSLQDKTPPQQFVMNKIDDGLSSDDDDQLVINEDSHLRNSLENMPQFSTGLRLPVMQPSAMAVSGVSPSMVPDSRAFDRLTQAQGNMMMPHAPGNMNTQPKLPAMPPRATTKMTPPGTKAKGCAPVREAVDPAKYVTIQEPDGIKYACSKCGNIYKWRKSLNKHWKEKHDGEIPDPRMKNYTALNIPRLKPGAIIGAGIDDPTRRREYGGASRPHGQMGMRLPRPIQNIQQQMQIHRPSPVRSNTMKTPTMDVGQFGIDHSMPPAESRQVPTNRHMFPGNMFNKISPHTSHVSSMFSPDGNTPHISHQTHNMSRNREQLQKSIHQTFNLPTKQFPSPGRASQELRSMVKAVGQKKEPPNAVDLSKQIQGQQMELDDGALDLSRKPIHIIEPKLETQVGMSQQMEPLDFSMKPSPKATVSNAEPYDDSNISREEESFGSAFSPIKYDIPELSVSLKLQCPSCAYIARNKHDYDEHTDLHLRKRHYKCAECQKVFFTIKELNDHFSEQHIDVIQQRLVVGSARRRDAVSDALLLQSGGGNMALMDHLSSKTPEATQLYKYLTMDSSHQLLACVVCGAIFQWQWTLAKHFEQDHPTLPNPYKKRPAEGSSKESSNTASPPPLHPADIPTKKSKASHDGADMEELQCQNCDFSAGTASELTRHQLKHSLGRQYNCEMCEFSTKWRDQFITHYRQVHPEKVSQLDPSMTAQELAALEQTGRIISGHHMIDLMEDTVFVMPEAPDDTESESDASKPYIAGRSGSNRHQQASPDTSNSAEALLPFKCSECEYRARWPSEIAQHMKNHSDEKPYLCPRCSYRSKWKWDVVKHLKRCGGGTVKDVIDTTKHRKQQHVKALLEDVLPICHRSTSSSSSSGVYPPGREVLSKGPPNVTVVSSMHEADRDHHTQNSSERDSSVCNSDVDHHMDLSLERESADSDSDSMIHPTLNTLRGVSIAMGGINQNQHFCHQCPFVGNSPAELKRHSRVHSDEKPFICKTCGYSSKWKCDLKKHLRTYNHTSAVPLTYGGHGRKPFDWADSGDNGSPGNSNDDSDGGMDEDEEEQMREASLMVPAQPTLYKCDRCQYVTYKKNMLDSHAKIHRQSGSAQGGKLKCKQCDFEAQDLPTFLQHKLTHSNTPFKGEAHSEVSGIDSRIDDRSSVSPSRHRRKPMHQHRIPQGADRDGGDGNNALDFSQKGPLPVGTVAPILHDNNGSEKTGTYHCNYCPFITDHKNNFEKHSKNHNVSNKYTCEWCNWSIDRLNLLYRHAQTVHPQQLAQQEKETFYCKVRNIRSSGSEESPLGTPGAEKHDSSEDLEEDIDGLCSTSPRPRVTSTGFTYTGSTEDGDQGKVRSRRRRRLKTCPKCGYITDNITTLQRHLAKHGSQGKFTCNFCDYSVDRQHILEYHIKIVHLGNEHSSRQLKTGRDVSLSTLNGEALSLIVKADTDEVKPDETPQKLEEGIGEFYETNGGLHSENIVKIKKYKLKVVRKGAKTIYSCPKCPFSAANITNAVKHAKQHGANRKYTCEYCNYSLDQLRHILHHMKIMHGHSARCGGGGSRTTSATGSNGALRYTSWRRHHCAVCRWVSRNPRMVVRHGATHGRLRRSRSRNLSAAVAASVGVKKTITEEPLLTNGGGITTRRNSRLRTLSNID